MTFNNRSKKFTTTLAGATIVVAMAYLEQEVTNRLIGEIAERIKSQDGKPTLQQAKQELPERFFDKLEPISSVRQIRWSSA
jgi:hypothetical protein